MFFYNVRDHVQAVIAGRVSCTRVWVVQLGGHSLEVVSRHGEICVCSSKLLVRLLTALLICAAYICSYPVGRATNVVEGRRIGFADGPVARWVAGSWQQRVEY
jgi:hypothetical protein